MSFWQDSRIDQILPRLLTYTPCEFSKGDRYTKCCDKETPDYNNWYLGPNLRAGTCSEVGYAEIHFTHVVRLKHLSNQHNTPSRPGRMLAENKKESTCPSLQLSSSPGSGWHMTKKGQDGHPSASSAGDSLVLQEGQRADRGRARVKMRGNQTWTCNGALKCTVTLTINKQN